MIKKIINRLASLTFPTYKLYLIHLMLRPNGFLFETGWINSVRRKQAINKNDEPIAWLTYPFLYFIEEKLQLSHKVFEYGSGNSTIYFSNKVNEITSIEHNLEYYKTMLSKLESKKNVRYYYCEINELDYPQAIEKFNEKYHIILIDGRQRVECIKRAINYLYDSGVIIFDNSLRDRYRDGIEFLTKNGFKHIHFRGLNPLGHSLTVTTIFYKNNNCLDI